MKTFFGFIMTFILLCAGVLVIPALVDAGDSGEVREGSMPELEMVALDGETVKLSELRGSVVLVDIWATWCKPCLSSLPYYAELYERHRKDGLVVLAISVDESRSDVEAYLKRRPLPFTVLHDSDHRVSRTFSPRTMPTLYMIDREGRVA
ncbi:MAG: TlpA disulfide reductase family protein, partial [Bradymonadaceae bacterium]